MTTIAAVYKKRKDNVDTNKEQLKNGAAVDGNRKLNEGKNKKAVLITVSMSVQ